MILLPPTKKILVQTTFKRDKLQQQTSNNKTATTNVNTTNNINITNQKIIIL